LLHHYQLCRKVCTASMLSNGCLLIQLFRFSAIVSHCSLLKAACSA
jgi:hypothetical protein